MTRRPPSSTLFPFAPLSQSVDIRRQSSELLGVARRAERQQDPDGQVCERHEHGAVEVRSEEHTSELQSRQYLVCRLLLEKKKDAPQNNRTSCCRWIIGGVHS